jgi:hypothetical protein
MILKDLSEHSTFPSYFEQARKKAAIRTSHSKFREIREIRGIKPCPDIFELPQKHLRVLWRRIGTPTLDDYEQKDIRTFGSWHAF